MQHSVAATQEDTPCGLWALKDRTDKTAELYKKLSASSASFQNSFEHESLTHFQRGGRYHLSMSVL